MASSSESCEGLQPPLPAQPEPSTSAPQQALSQDHSQQSSLPLQQQQQQGQQQQGQQQQQQQAAKVPASPFAAPKLQERRPETLQLGAHASASHGVMDLPQGSGLAATPSLRARLLSPSARAASAGLPGVLAAPVLPPVVHAASSPLIGRPDRQPSPGAWRSPFSVPPTPEALAKLPRVAALHASLEGERGPLWWRAAAAVAKAGDASNGGGQSPTWAWHREPLEEGEAAGRGDGALRLSVTLERPSLRRSLSRLRSRKAPSTPDPTAESPSPSLSQSRSRSRRSFGDVLRRRTSDAPALHPEDLAQPEVAEPSTPVAEEPPLHDVPPLNIVMLVVGTRGDVQPFIALGHKMKAYGHRVRLASHTPYREFVESNGLEFFPLGGDPRLLSEYMVKNRGLLPGSYHEIVTQREQLKEIIWSTYPACTQPDPDHPDQPFTAEAIIANPVCWGHIHCAEKLQVPLHMFFTMPWTATKEFPHPMARMMYEYQLGKRLIKLAEHFMYYSTVADAYTYIHRCARPKPGAPLRERLAYWLFGFQRLGRSWVISQMEMANALSYMAIDDLLFPGMADLLNQFRAKVLELPSMYWTQGCYVHALEYFKIPFTYCWSPALVPKPADWGANIDVVGFFFLGESERTGYKPPPELAAFLGAGPPPVYIGFGSLVVDKPVKVSKKLYKALAQVKQRAVISKGWGNLGVIPGQEVPENVLLIDAVPHDWLFLRCSAVIHHGGAGTTAAGLWAACPTTVIPFFGDQPFWGQACKRAGAGPRPISVDWLRTAKLVKALEVMARPETKAAAQRISTAIRAEDGVTAGMDSFHRQLPAPYVLEKWREIWEAQRTPTPGLPSVQRPSQASPGVELAPVNHEELAAAQDSPATAISQSPDNSDMPGPGAEEAEATLSSPACARSEASGLSLGTSAQAAVGSTAYQHSLPSASSAAGAEVSSFGTARGHRLEDDSSSSSDDEACGRAHDLTSDEDEGKPAAGKLMTIAQQGCAAARR